MPLGVYGTAPPPGGFRLGDTAGGPGGHRPSAVEVALEVDAPTPATVVAATVIRDGTGLRHRGPC